MLFFGVLMGAAVLMLFANLAARPAQGAAGEMTVTMTGETPADTPPSAQSAQTQPEQNQPEPAPIDAPASESCSLGQRFPEAVRRWCEPLERHAAAHGLDPNLVAAVMLQESGGNPNALSHSGAVGLLQVMPRDGVAASFMCKNGPCFSARPSMAELYDPEYNLSYGTRMLAGLVARLGSVREALRAYGPGDAGYTYADKVLAIYAARAER